MGASRDEPARSRLLWSLVAGAAVLITWTFPPFHVVRLSPNASPSAKGVAAFDPKAVAVNAWREQLPAAIARAPEVAVVVAAIRKAPESAKTQFGRASGVGATYYFVRGQGRVVGRERNQLVIAPDGAAGEVVALRIGPIFGNSVRDGCGLFDLNSSPGLAEFNALAAELNSLVEQQILPPLRSKAQIGTTVTFAGCAEAPESIADAGEPILMIVPVSAHIP